MHMSSTNWYQVDLVTTHQPICLNLLKQLTQEKDWKTFEVRKRKSKNGNFYASLTTWSRAKKSFPKKSSRKIVLTALNKKISTVVTIHKILLLQHSNIVTNNSYQQCFSYLVSLHTSSKWEALWYSQYIRQRKARRGSTSSTMKTLVVFALVALGVATAWSGYMSDEPDGEILSWQT